MFLVIGLINVALGIFVVFFVPDTPMSARFLTNDEKVVLLEHIKVNQTGIKNRHFHPRQLIEGLLDIGCQYTFETASSSKQSVLTINSTHKAGFFTSLPFCNSWGPAL